MRSRASSAACLIRFFLLLLRRRALALSDLRLFPISISCSYVCTFFGPAAPDRAGARPYQSQRHRLLKSANPRLLRRDVKLDRVDNSPRRLGEVACILQSNAIVATSPYNATPFPETMKTFPCPSPGSVASLTTALATSSGVCGESISLMKSETEIPRYFE